MALSIEHEQHRGMIERTHRDNAFALEKFERIVDIIF
jgi:hypothetical protein